MCTDTAAHLFEKATFRPGGTLQRINPMDGFNKKPFGDELGSDESSTKTELIIFECCRSVRGTPEFLASSE